MAAGAIAAAHLRKGRGAVAEPPSLRVDPAPAFREPPPLRVERSPSVRERSTKQDSAASEWISERSNSPPAPESPRSLKKVVRGVLAAGRLQQATQGQGQVSGAPPAYSSDGSGNAPVLKDASKKSLYVSPLWTTTSSSQKRQSTETTGYLDALHSRGVADQSRPITQASSRRSMATILDSEVRKDLAYRIFCSPLFELAIDVCIVLNLVCITYEQSYRLQDKDTSIFRHLEHAFLGIYVFELLARFYVWGMACFQSQFFIFDFLIVMLGVSTSWVINPIFGDIEQLSPLFMLRIARLLRLARALRLFEAFRELWMLVQGLVNAVRTMFYTLVLLLIILYAFGSVSLELLTKHRLATSEDFDPEFKEIIDKNFSDLPTAMLSLLQFVSFDNMVQIYRPLVTRDWSLLPFFSVVILVVGIVFMNLVTAVIVNNALEQAANDLDLNKSIERAKKKKLVREMRDICIRLDKDGSGEISRDEIQRICEEDVSTLARILGMRNPLEVFDALDVNRDEAIGIDEFIDGVWQVFISDTPLHVKRLEQQVANIRQEIKETQDLHLDVHQKVDDTMTAILQLRDYMSAGVRSRDADLNVPSTVDFVPASAMRMGKTISGDPVASKHVQLPTVEGRRDVASAASNWERDFSPFTPSLPSQKLGSFCSSDSPPPWAVALLNEIRALCKVSRGLMREPGKQQRSRRPSGCSAGSVRSRAGRFIGPNLEDDGEVSSMAELIPMLPMKSAKSTASSAAPKQVGARPPQHVADASPLRALQVQQDPDLLDLRHCDSPTRPAVRGNGADVVLLQPVAEYLVQDPPQPIQVEELTQPRLSAQVPLAAIAETSSLSSPVIGDASPWGRRIDHL